MSCRDSISSLPRSSRWSWVLVVATGCTAGPPPSGTGTSGGTAPEPGPVVEDTTSGSADGDSSGTAGGGLACLDDQFVNGPSPGPDYTMFDVEIGSHCQGTNQQEITDIERVVFLGDAVTVGTPPTGAEDSYRAILADELAMLYGLQAPNLLWKEPDVISGTATVQQSGDFASCAMWGTGNDDLLSQLEECFAPGDHDLRTLVVMTMGGSDLAFMVQNAIAGAAPADLLMSVEVMLDQHEQAIEWLMDEGKFPNGVFVVDANVYEFTDYTVDLLSCPAASVEGFDFNPEDPDALLALLNQINEGYMRVAERWGTDVVFMFEGFCGHGFRADDASTPCYRGAGNETWFGVTCTQPTTPGHSALADMFINVISE